MIPTQSPGRDLPPEIQSVLRAIASDMRNVPRENCATIMDVFLYFRRQAARVEGVCKMRVSNGPKPALRPPAGRPLSARERAETVFGRTGRPARETITCRKGREVRVERRARQLEMSV